MSSNTEMQKSIIVVLNQVTQNFVNYLPPIFGVFGLIGFIGNVFTYLQPDLRLNTCCIYSLCGSITDIITLLNFLPSYLNRVYGIPTLWRFTRFLCKLALFLIVFLPASSYNFLLMAIIDRFACTCALTSPIRRINQFKMVPLMITIILIVTFLTSLFALICFDFNSVGACVNMNATVYSIFYIIFIGFGPSVLMLIFVLLTYRNVRQSRRRVGGTAGEFNTRQMRNQFIAMIFAQIATTGFLTMQRIIMYMYDNVITVGKRNDNDSAIIQFTSTLSLYFFYLNNVKSFYISLLTSNLFRKTFVKGFIALLPRQMRQRFHRFEIEGRVATLAKGNHGNMTRQ